MKERLQQLIGFSAQRHSVRAEILAGVTTFFAMMYVLMGCVAVFTPLKAQGFPVDAIFTATALTAAVGTLFMAFIAKRPFAVAPGMSFNLFVVQTICMSLGYSWQFALTAVLIEGILFVLLCLSGLRQVVFEIVPASLKYSFAAGVGLLIALMGFKYSGLLSDGTIFSHLETLSKPGALLFILGLVFTAFFSVLKVPGALLISMVLTTLVGIPIGVTQLPTEWWSMPSSPTPLFFQFAWSEVLTPDMWVCVIALLFFDVFDTLGTTTGMMANAGLIRKNGRLPFQREIMLSDALATVTGACMGCATANTYPESCAGIAEGGRTGLSALVTALCFILCLFIWPLLSAIPIAASLPLVVISGFYLFSVVRHINYKNPVEAMPAFCTITIIVVTSSVIDGIVTGLFAYGALSVLESSWKHRKDTDETV